MHGGDGGGKRKKVKKEACEAREKPESDKIVLY
jgi:hypothetical protein